MDEWEMSRIQDQEAWDQYAADYYAEAAAARRVAAVPPVVIALLARRRSVAWPRLTETEVVPAMLAVVLVAFAAGVAVVVVVGQAGMVMLLGCFANLTTPTDT